MSIVWRKAFTALLYFLLWWSMWNWRRLDLFFLLKDLRLWLLRLFGLLIWLRCSFLFLLLYLHDGQHCGLVLDCCLVLVELFGGIDQVIESFLAVAGIAGEQLMG